jgi:hypothetical protein
MDVICFMTPFPLMGWSWTPTSVEPIHLYHSKLWEDKAKDFFYEICNYVVVSMHVAIYGCPPPRISDKIVTNLGKIADWYIEEHFSYIRVFGCSVPPHALPKFLPDRLVCREVAHQTVLGGINKELKAVQKKVWPTFPLQIGMFSLLDFGHSKVEAAALEEIKLVNIEFKKHDPQKIVGNHMALYNLKRYEHEDSPQDDIFRGARSYQEVLSRVQTLAPDKLVEFYNFQRHRRNGLPKVLQGETPTPPATQKIEVQSLETRSSSGQDAQENLEKTEVLTQKGDTTLTNPPSDQAKAQTEALIKKGEENPLSTPGKSATDTVGKQPSTEIGSPVQSITPLQFSRGNPSAEVVFIEDLTPISVEEMPPSDFFFSKKRRVVVKRETHQKEGAIVKRHRVLFDGQALEEADFATEVAGSLGDFATTNQYSVGNLKEQLKQKDLLVSQLQNQVKTVEQNVRSEMNKSFEQIRACDRQEIQQLKFSLDEMHKNAQASREWASQQGELVKQLQAKINLTENTVL